MDDDRKVDLSRLLIDIYGVGYTEHPRLTTLLAKNKIKPLDFLSGAEEAAAFDSGNYVGLHQSTLRKVDVIANIASRAHDKVLTTNTSWWEMHGGRARSILGWMAESRIFQVGAGLASLLGLLFGILALIH